MLFLSDVTLGVAIPAFRFPAAHLAKLQLDALFSRVVPSPTQRPLKDSIFCPVSKLAGHLVVWLVVNVLEINLKRTWSE